MRTALLFSFSVLLPAAGQDPAVPAEPVDRILLSDRTELQGELTGYEASGLLRFKNRESGRALRIPVEEAVKLQFGKDEPVRTDARAERARLFFGGTLSGKIASYERGTAVVESRAGILNVRRDDIKALVLAPLAGPLPELKEEKKDILIREVGKESAAFYGELVSIGEKVLFKVAEEKTSKDREFDRAAVKQIYFHHDKAAPELPPGWFVKILLKNGDKLIGVPRGFTKEKVRVFSHLFGETEIEKAVIHSLTFVQYARMTVGNILVCDQNGVREMDRQGNALWTYNNNTQYAWSAQKLENGNVLIANTNYNQILEVEPSGKSGGKIVWQLENSNYPYDASRLENGNTLVAEYYSSRVAEYDPKKNLVWQCPAVQYPISAQRLEGGNTLICSNQVVVEVDREAKEVWKAPLKGVTPYRAQRLENGNTLIVDCQRNQVVEVDPQSKEVWKMDKLNRPVQAIRLEDGNTLILEQGLNRIIEVDPSKRQVMEIPKLNYPQGMSTY